MTDTMLRSVALQEARRNYSSRPCPVCVFPRKIEVEAALDSGVSPKGIHQQFPELSAAMIRKHRDCHTQIARDAVGKIAAAASRWVPQIDELITEAKKRIDSLDAADHKTFAMMTRVFSNLATFAAKLEGEIKTGSQVNVLNLTFAKYNLRDENELATIVRSHQATGRMTDEQKQALMEKILMKKYREDPEARARSLLFREVA